MKLNIEYFYKIIEEKKYEKLKYNHIYNSVTADDEYIKIYTKDGAYIRFSKNWYLDGGLLKCRKISRFIINFFVPEEDTSIKTIVRIDTDSDYKKLDYLFDELIKEIRNNQVEKYF